ncbi:MAG: GNAT family N-acetyltransferase [Clostridia bacterium]|nr:GNAT family N-acetyltransferase [Clostridia bacterium]
MNIRLAEEREANRIKSIYEGAVSFMRSTGNTNQWTGGYPSVEIILADIRARNLYVCEEDGTWLAVFFYRHGDDPTYRVIYDGEWLNDEKYGVIHRIAVTDAARGRGVAAHCYEYALSKSGNVKIDTHRDNLPMQHSLLKNGFTYCGIIHLENGDERLAYQKCNT